MNFLIGIMLLSTTLVRAAQYTLEDYKDQANIIEEILNKQLPSPKTKEYDWDLTIWEGKTAKGEYCAITRNGILISLIQHPELSEAQKQYKDFSFEWDFDQLTSNILGIPVRPSFTLSASTLEATATIPRGYLTVARIGVKLAFDGKKISLSVRNRSSLLSNYKECIFKK